MNNSDNWIYHFGVRVKKTPRLLISRETYAVINKKNSLGNEAFARKVPERYEGVYEDENCTTYTDEWCNNQREKCLRNFDLNMQYMSNLSDEDFNRALTKFLKIKKFIRILDLNDCKDMCGIYVLVLGKYKQIYIGQSNNIKRRIMDHWSKNKPFDRLIYGSEEKSILSIDSFGALDTTQIYVFQTPYTFDYEKKFVSKMDQRFLINRTGGGIGRNKEYAMEIIANSKHRNFK